MGYILSIPGWIKLFSASYPGSFSKQEEREKEPLYEANISKVLLFNEASGLLPGLENKTVMIANIDPCRVHTFATREQGEYTSRPSPSLLHGVSP